MLALLLLSLAHAGELRIQTYEPVLVQVDAKVRELDDETHAAWAMDLRPGPHTVRILDARGRVLLEQEVEVDREDRVRMGYIDDALVITRVEGLDGHGRPLPRPGVDDELPPRPHHPRDLVEDEPPPPPEPAEPPPPPPPEPMAEDAFGALVKVVHDASFPSDKVELVRTAVVHNHFTIAQLGALLDELVHSSDRIEVAKLVAPKVLDPGNAFLLESHLTFKSEKEEILALFR